MKKLLCLLVSICCMFAAFAQNVKPFTVDLNDIDAANEDKSMTYDKSSRVITVDRDYEDQTGLGLWLDKDISSYNIIRIKYEALGDYGFHIYTCYKNRDSEFRSMS